MKLDKRNERERTLAVQSSADLILLKTGMPSRSTISCKTSWPVAKSSYSLYETRKKMNIKMMVIKRRNCSLKIPFRDGFTLDELSRSIQRMNDEDKCFLRCRVICGFDDSGHTSSLSVNDEKQDVGRLFGLVLLFDQFRTPLRHLLLVTNVLFIYYVTGYCCVLNFINWRI